MMKTRIFTKLFYALLATMLLTSCDEHFEEDFSWHSWMPGMVYSTNEIGRASCRERVCLYV